jgi:hypothetical protein
VYGFSAYDVRTLLPSPSLLPSSPLLPHSESELIVDVCT